MFSPSGSWLSCLLLQAHLNACGPGTLEKREYLFDPAKYNTGEVHAVLNEISQWVFDAHRHGYLADMEDELVKVGIKIQLLLADHENTAVLESFFQLLLDE